MSALDAIAIRVEAFSGNVAPLLHEVRHAIARLIETGESTVIDINSIPLAPGEQGRILEALGSGEVRAELHALGRSEITETAFPGAWLVRHLDENGDQKALFIEIARLPEILLAQPGDIVEGLERLTSRLESMAPARAPRSVQRTESRGTPP